MAYENFLINPPKRLKRKRKRNPIGETLTIIGANPSRRNPMTSNPWYGNSAGHRRAALIRWGKVRNRKRGKKVARRKVSYVARRRRTIDRRTVAYKQSRKKQYSQLKGFLSLTAPGPSRRFRYVSGEGWAATRRRKNMAKRRRSRKRNTWFGQPRRHRKASKKGWRIGHMVPFSHAKRSKRRRVRHRNPMVSANPRRKRHYKARHRRRNPAIMAEFGRFTSGVMNVREWGPLAVTGGLSAITGAVVPGMLGVYNPWAKYGVQTAVAIGGGLLVERVVDKRHGQAWMIVGVAMVGYQLLKEFVLQPYFPQFAVGLGEYENYYPVSSYADQSEVSQQVGAFPGVDAFPGVSDYPGVGAYPYDGAGY